MVTTLSPAQNRAHPTQTKVWAFRAVTEHSPGVYRMTLSVFRYETGDESPFYLEGRIDPLNLELTFVGKSLTGMQVDENSLTVQFNYAGNAEQLRVIERMLKDSIENVYGVTVFNK